MGLIDDLLRRKVDADRLKKNEAIQRLIVQRRTGDKNAQIQPVAQEQSLLQRLVQAAKQATQNAPQKFANQVVQTPIQASQIGNQVNKRLANAATGDLKIAADIFKPERLLGQPVKDRNLNTAQRIQSEVLKIPVELLSRGGFAAYEAGREAVPFVKNTLGPVMKLRPQTTQENQAATEAARRGVGAIGRFAGLKLLENSPVGKAVGLTYKAGEKGAMNIIKGAAGKSLDSALGFGTRQASQAFGEGATPEQTLKSFKGGAITGALIPWLDSFGGSETTKFLGMTTGEIKRRGANALFDTVQGAQEVLNLDPEAAAAWANKDLGALSRAMVKPENIGRIGMTIGTGQMTQTFQEAGYKQMDDIFRKLSPAEQNQVKGAFALARVGIIASPLEIPAVAGLVGGVGAKGFDVANDRAFSNVKDRQTRFQISDENAQFRYDNIEKAAQPIEGGLQIKLGDLLDHKDLYSRYPDAKNITVELVDAGAGRTGAYSPQRDTIQINPNQTDRTTLLHEIQHALQTREGFMRGGSPDDQAMAASSPEKAYQSLGGEIEARSVADNANRPLSELQRTDTFGEQMARDGIKDVVVRMDDPEVQALVQRRPESAGKIEKIINNDSLSAEQKLTQLEAIRAKLPEDQKSQIPEFILTRYRQTSQEAGAGVGDAASLPQSSVQGNLPTTLNSGDVAPIRNFQGPDTGPRIRIGGKRGPESTKVPLRLQPQSPRPTIRVSTGDAPSSLRLGQTEPAQPVLRLAQSANQSATDTPLRFRGFGSATNVTRRDNPLVSPAERQDFLDFLKEGTSLGQGQSLEGVGRSTSGQQQPQGKTPTEEQQRLLDRFLVDRRTDTTARREPGGGIPPLKEISGQGKDQTQRQSSPSGQGRSVASSATESELNSYDRIIKGKDYTPAQKVGLLDYLRTPTKVLKKIGLGKEAELLEKAHETYLNDLETEIGRISDWASEVPDAGASKRIFKYLDGQKVTLNPKEQKVAGEIKTYLSDWADKLGLPQDGRIAQYITHIFEKDFIEKEFDPDLAKIIADKVPGSVYDPFLEQRLGKQGYVEDAWRALDAYVKRATRKYNMDPALEKLKAGAEGQPLENYKYIQELGEKINLRPDNVDTLLDNTLKTMFGYREGQRPVARLSRKWRRLVYRGALGLNVGSATRNLTQGVNTYAKLGEKYTTLGYVDLIRNWTGNNLKELQEQGILRDNMIQDRTISARKNLIQKMDKGLFAFFDTAEKINRGSAYFGAKRKGMSQGMSEQKAIDYAKNIVKDTQFTFGNIDTPLALNGDVKKTLLQFQSFNVKQAEFLSEMVGNKDFAGMIRYAAGTALMTNLLGEILGYTWDQAIPFSDIITGEGRIATPAVNAVQGVLNTVFGDDQRKKEGSRQLQNTLKLLIPGGVQIGKSAEGIDAFNKGYSATGTPLDKLMGNAGGIRYGAEQNLGNAIRSALFGQYSTPEARQYFDKELTPLGETDTETVKSAEPADRPGIIDLIRKRQGLDNEAKDKKKQTQQRAAELVPVMKSMSADQRADFLKSQPDFSQELVESVRSQWRESRVQEVRDEKGLVTTPEEQAISNAGSSEAKAQLIFEMLQPLPVSDRKAQYQELYQKGVISREVAIQVRRLFESRN